MNGATEVTLRARINRKREKNVLHGTKSMLEIREPRVRFAGKSRLADLCACPYLVYMSQLKRKLQ